MRKLNVEVFCFSPIQENTYVLYNQQECVIIDPGCYSDEEKNRLFDWISSRGLEVKMIWLTHGHLDHVFGLKAVCEQYGLVPFICPLEQEVYKMASAAGLMYQLPFDLYNDAFQYYEEGDVLHWSDLSFQIFHTPGHSPGSVSIYQADSSLVFAGDVLFKESIGRTDLPGGHSSTLLESIRVKLFSLPEDTVVYPGHMEPTTIGHEKRFNPFFN